MALPACVLEKMNAVRGGLHAHSILDWYFAILLCCVCIDLLDFVSSAQENAVFLYDVTGMRGALAPLRLLLLSVLVAVLPP